MGKPGSTLESWGATLAVVAMLAAAVLAFAKAEYTANEALQSSQDNSCVFREHEKKNMNESLEVSRWMATIDERLKNQCAILDKIERKVK
jgi:uncharacterized protein involved in exopolysaccharide biosynthesis